MSKRESYEVAGVDGCKGGWCVAVARVINQTGKANADCILQLRRFFVASGFAEVLAETGDCELVCVDIPIGLCEGEGARECDTAARRLLGGRRASSVFPAPVRPCLWADDYETACAISLQRSGKKLSRQSFGLLKKIREVDGLMTPELQERVREIHPEVSFWVLNGNHPIGRSKKTAGGQTQRCRLLGKVFAEVDGILTGMERPGCAADDALDALVAAWTAAQAVSGKTGMLPENPGRDSRGLRIEILCPAV